MRGDSNLMKSTTKKLIICLIIPLAVGGLSALLTMGSMEQFEKLNQPPLSPPSWLFPVVWTILFVLMGIASYLVLTSGDNASAVKSTLTFYGIQLVFNFFWTIIFFNLRLYLVAFVWLIILWVLILTTLIGFFRISKPAGWLMLPYLIWVAFAGYLNIAIFFLNS